jgi:phage terminase large subunit
MRLWFKVPTLATFPPRPDARGICEVHIDPLLEVRAFFDIGVADATSIWLAQFSGGAIHIIDYIEGVSQPLSYYVNELRSKGYEKARCILPHDGVNKSVITGKRYEDHLKDAGFQTEVIPNAGAGAARMRIEAVRRILPRCHFDEKRCEAGVEALAWYHERLDEHREVGLGPLHDWSSHADSFGLLAVSYEEPSRTARAAISLASARRSSRVITHWASRV